MIQPVERGGEWASPGFGPTSGPASLSAVESYFDRRSGYWDEIYEAGTCDGDIYRDRLLLALRWAESLASRPAARALDAGCGAGLAATALAQMGFRVDALDVAPAMVARALRRADEAGVAERVCCAIGDVHHLAFPEGTFDLVVALGVLPWTLDPTAAVREMARVLKAGGHLLVSADHSAALPRLADLGRYWPAALPARAIRRLSRLVRGAAASAAAPETPPAARHSRAQVDEWLAAAGLAKTRDATVGFGPFTLFDHKVLGDRENAALHRALQRLAERRVAGLHRLGWHYVVLACKGAAQERPTPGAGELNGGTS